MSSTDGSTAFEIRPAKPGDEAAIAQLIHALAEYEKLSDQCIVTPEMIRSQIFGEKPAAEVLIAWSGGEAVAFALFFS